MKAQSKRTRTYEVTQVEVTLDVSFAEFTRTFESLLGRMEEHALEGLQQASPDAIRAKLASFVGMSEVLFAAAFAWLMLDQVPTATQFAGGTLILAGVVLIRADER